MATILVVDDEKPVREFLAFFFEAEGYRVVEAMSGQEALALLANERPDLVVSDVMMPVLSGIELCRRLKSGADTRDIPVILVSAGTLAGQAAAEAAGADGYLDKPFSLDALQALVQRWAPQERAG